MASSSHWDGSEESDDDRDDALDEDLEALRRACMITGKNLNDIEGSSYIDSEGESTDDLDLVRSIQERFPIPLAVAPPTHAFASRGFTSDSDDGDDFETLRAIQRRFAKYDSDEKHLQKGVVISDKKRNSEEAKASDDAAHPNDIHPNDSHQWSDGINNGNQSKDGTCNLSELSLKKSYFPMSAQMFIEAIKKNRSSQKFIRSKLIEIEAKVEENKQLKGRLKCLVDFQACCKRKAGYVLTNYKDPRIKLISHQKDRILKNEKIKDKKMPAMYAGPEGNSHVETYNMVLRKFPLSFSMQPWSKTENENLAKGIKQQFQEKLLQRSIEQYSDSERSSGDSSVIDCIIASISDLEITPENMRSFLPQVDWDRLASMYLLGRSGAECEVRWLNLEDPMINHNPWTTQEDKKLLYIAQQRGIYNWVEIATLLGTNRTPCQCLVRYQRSLNAYIVKKQWTEDEDAQLRAVVEAVGEDDWQLVASHLESRTGRQCSNRWLKTLHPSRERIGRWSLDEDKRLNVAVTLFGPKTWHKIAKYVPGRTQVQCRERWFNILNPSINLGEWTDEEDFKLKSAIAEHGRCWSKVAALVPSRTDCQCRRRWKVLFPDDVQLARAEQKIQRAALLTNFADREVERPALSPNDFLFSSEVTSISENGIDNNTGKPKRKGRAQSDKIGNVNLKAKTKKSKDKAKACDKGTLIIAECSDMNCEENGNLMLTNNGVALDEVVAPPQKKTRRRKIPKLLSKEDACIQPADCQLDPLSLGNSERSVLNYVSPGDASVLQTSVVTEKVSSKISRAKGKARPKETSVTRDGNDATKRGKRRRNECGGTESVSDQVEGLPQEMDGPIKLNSKSDTCTQQAEDQEYLHQPEQLALSSLSTNFASENTMTGPTCKTSSKTHRSRRKVHLKVNPEVTEQLELPCLTMTCPSENTVTDPTGKTTSKTPRSRRKVYPKEIPAGAEQLELPCLTMTCPSENTVTDPTGKTTSKTPRSRRKVYPKEIPVVAEQLELSSVISMTCPSDNTVTDTTGKTRSKAPRSGRKVYPKEIPAVTEQLQLSSVTMLGPCENSVTDATCETRSKTPRSRRKVYLKETLEVTEIELSSRSMICPSGNTLTVPSGKIKSKNPRSVGKVNPKETPVVTEGAEVAKNVKRRRLEPANGETRKKKNASQTLSNTNQLVIQLDNAPGNNGVQSQVLPSSDLFCLNERQDQSQCLSNNDELLVPSFNNGPDKDSIQSCIHSNGRFNQEFDLGLENLPSSDKDGIQSCIRPFNDLSHSNRLSEQEIDMGVGLEHFPSSDKDGIRPSNDLSHSIRRSEQEIDMGVRLEDLPSPDPSHHPKDMIEASVLSFPNVIAPLHLDTKLPMESCEM